MRKSLPLGFSIITGGEITAYCAGTTALRLPSGKLSVTGTSGDDGVGDNGCCDSADVDGRWRFLSFNLKNKINIKCIVF